MDSVALRVIGGEQRGQARVEGDELTVVANGELEEKGVGDLLVANEALTDGRHQTGHADIIWPEVMLWAFRVGFENAESVVGRDQRFDDLGRGGEPHESGLSQGASGPAVVAVCREPSVGEVVMEVVRPGEGKEHINIK